MSLIPTRHVRGYAVTGSHAFMQSRRLEVRLRMPKTPEGENVKEYVHMLNGTLTATERTICCLLENYQTSEGVRCVPTFPSCNILCAASNVCIETSQYLPRTVCAMMLLQMGW